MADAYEREQRTTRAILADAEQHLYGQEAPGPPMSGLPPKPGDLVLLTGAASFLYTGTSCWFRVEKVTLPRSGTPGWVYVHGRHADVAEPERAVYVRVAGLVIRRG